MSNQIKKHDLPKGFVVILAMLTSITPLAIDVYLPSFTRMTEFFYTSIDQIEITLSIFLLGFALGQLIGGPLSDRYGRKIFIYGGLTLYIISSFLISQSTTLEQLWIFRFLQAIGGGFAVVNTNAIVRDLYRGKEGAKVFSVIAMIMMVAPMFAPIIGSTILYFFSWQYIFIFLTLYGVFLFYFITKLPETSPRIKDRNYFENYIKILTNKRAVMLMLAGGFGIAGMFVFITKSSFIYMGYFNVDAKYFTVFFSLNVLGLIILSRVNMKLLDRYSSFRLFVFGILMQLASALCLLLIGEHHTIYSVAILIMFYVGSLGFVFANAISLLLEHFGHISGTANAINGVVGFILSAFTGFLASVIHDGTLQPIFILMVGTPSLSLFILFIIHKRIKGFENE